MSSELNVMDALATRAREGHRRVRHARQARAVLAGTYQRILDLDNKTRVTIDRETGRIYVYEQIPDPEWEGEPEEAPIVDERDVTPPDVSRIAAQNAKSVITTIIRDAERERIFEEYADRIGESVTGTVQQSEPRYTLIKLREGVEALLPPSEQPNNERYNHNQRIKAYIIDVRKGQGNEPSIVVSRTHPGLIRRLFEIEVPEVYDGIVEIKSVAREPGARSKVAVSSREPASTPWAPASARRAAACAWSWASSAASASTSCRGTRSRHRPTSRRSRRPRSTASSSTRTPTPRRSSSPDDQLSLAIGKEGQNARLAAKLTGWRIDIKSSTMAAEQGSRALLGVSRRMPPRSSTAAAARHLVRGALPQPGASGRLLLRSTRRRPPRSDEAAQGTRPARARAARRLRTSAVSCGSCGPPKATSRSIRPARPTGEERTCARTRTASRWRASDAGSTRHSG